MPLPSDDEEEAAAAAAEPAAPMANGSGGLFGQPASAPGTSLTAAGKGAGKRVAFAEAEATKDQPQPSTPAPGDAPAKVGNGVRAALVWPYYYHAHSKPCLSRVARC